MQWVGEGLLRSRSGGDPKLEQLISVGSRQFRDTPIELNAAVGVLARHFGFWSLNVSGSLSIDERGPIEEFGFAYGTLASQVERGEERFQIEWHRDDDSVWYDILAFSRPNQYLIRFAQPIARTLQKRFAKDSLKVMAEVVRDEVAR